MERTNHYRYRFLGSAEHLLRKIEKVMDYAWLYERLDPYYCHDNGRFCCVNQDGSYAQRKETIERVFADAKEKHAMRYTHHRGLAAVTRWAG